jgi:hypothetical protein
MNKRKEIIKIKETTLETGYVRTEKSDTCISKQNKEKLSINCLKDILDCMPTIDFPIEYYKGTNTVFSINKKREELRKLQQSNDSSEANVIYMEIVLEEYEPSTKFKIDIITNNLIRLAKGKGCRLATINRKSCYYNNFHWEELSEDFMKEYLYFIAKKSGFIMDPYTPKTEFTDPLHKKFQKLSTIRTKEITSNKERLEFQQKIETYQGMEGLKLFPN